MSDKLLNINEVTLQNNCPECYNTNGLHLLFKQKVIETPFYKALTSEIHNEIICKTCETTIYPEQWTVDIERVVNYQKKAFVPKPALTKLKTMSWILIIGGITLIAVAIFMGIYLNL